MRLAVPMRLLLALLAVLALAGTPGPALTAAARSSPTWNLLLLGPTLPPALRPLDQVCRVDMDMRGMWPYWWPRRGNFPDATEWGAERAASLAATWQARCRKGGVKGQVVVLAHSGGTLAAERMLQAGMRVDALALWSPGMKPGPFAATLQRAGLDAKHVLVVSGPEDMRRYRWFWHAREYPGSRWTGKRWQALEVRDRRFRHATMLILGDRQGMVRGTLPGLSRRRSSRASPNLLARQWLRSALDPRRPALFLVIGGTDTRYEPGSAASQMEAIALLVVQGRTGRQARVVASSQYREQRSGRWHPDGRVRVPAAAGRQAPGQAAIGDKE